MRVGRVKKNGHAAKKPHCYVSVLEVGWRDFSECNSRQPGSERSQTSVHPNPKTGEGGIGG